MTSFKVLIPNKSWIVEDEGKKIGTIEKQGKGYSFLCNGQTVKFNSLAGINERFGFEFTEVETKEVPEKEEYQVCDYPCNSYPFNPLYNVKNKLPIYTKSEKSKSVYCAGHYAIKFQKGWVKSFCPKLLTLTRNPYHGPFKTESDLKNYISTVLRHSDDKATKHDSD